MLITANVHPGWQKITTTCQELKNVNFNLAGAIICARAKEGRKNSAWGFPLTGHVVSGCNGSATITFYQNRPQYRPGVWQR